MKTTNKTVRTPPEVFLKIDESTMTSNVEVKAALLDLLIDLQKTTAPIGSRFMVSRIVRSHGFVAYVGGRHVSVNEASVANERLAIIVGNFGEWL